MSTIYDDGSFDLILTEKNIWEIYESFSEKEKIKALHRWIYCYKNIDTDFAKSMIIKCHELLNNYV